MKKFLFALLLMLLSRTVLATPPVCFRIDAKALMAVTYQAVYARA